MISDSFVEFGGAYKSKASPPNSASWSFRSPRTTWTDPKEGTYLDTVVYMQWRVPGNPIWFKVDNRSSLYPSLDTANIVADVVTLNAGVSVHLPLSFSRPRNANCFFDNPLKVNAAARRLRLYGSV